MADKKEAEELIEFEYDHLKYDSSNPLVLPSKRRKTNLVVDKKDIQEKILSRKRKKELEKKVQQKEKKLSRSELWKELENYKKTINEPDVSVLPLFNGVKKCKENKNFNFVKGKSWRCDSYDSSDSLSTDEYSSDDLMGKEVNNKTESDDVVKAGSPVINTINENSIYNVQSKPNPARFVLVSRSDEIMNIRLNLPIIAHEALIMESISENDCVIICGATGSGKTTQVPQFLYESGYSLDGYMIGITEPRRVAAISMAKRVGYELNLMPNQVSYHIRYEKTVDKSTLMKFMTDGVLLQEIKQDFELSKYAAIIVDEAHERSIYTDVLLGIISMVIRLRRSRYEKKILTRGRLLPPLKLIIMSATLKITEFSENRRLFPESSPPIIQVESRQFPVTCHFSKITHADYLKAAFRKVVTIHRDAALSGGILVFVTGQREVLTLCSWLTRAFPKSLPEKTGTNGEAKNVRLYTEEKTRNIRDLYTTQIDLDNFDVIPVDEATELGHVRLGFSMEKTEHSDFHCEDGNIDFDEIEDDEEILQQIKEARSSTINSPIQALPLYSLLSSELQQRVFEFPPEGYRQVIVATNVAETSLTIPGIRYVVDTGKVKTKVYDLATGASSFQIVPISQASAEQRAGRAGRTAPGHCYRLYSSQVFSNMKPFAYPDILTRPIDEVVLMLKSFLGNISLSLFPLPTFPSVDAVEAAERRLVMLQALDEVKKESNVIRTINKTGMWMTRIPLPVRFARMLLFANQHNLMPYAVILVASLSVPDLFISCNVDDPMKSEDELMFRSNFIGQFVRNSADLLLGDLAVMLGSICCLERYAAQLNGLLPPEPNILQFCDSANKVSHDPEGVLRSLVSRCGVRWNAYKEIRQLRKQLTEILNVNIPDLGLTVDPCLARPTSSQIYQLRQLFLVGSPCNVATKLSIPFTGLPASGRQQLRYAYEIPGHKGPVYIDSNSPLARENCPFVAYLDLVTTNKPTMRTVCSIDPKWLPFLAPNSFTVDGLVLSDETLSEMVASLPDQDKVQAEDLVTEDDKIGKLKFEASSSVLLPSPCYDPDQDMVITGAKIINYIGSGVVSTSNLCSNQTYLELPNSIVLVPIHCPASIMSIGENEALTWSVRWFLRFIFEGVVFSEFKQWFPSRIKKSISPQLLTVSWGIIRPEVRNLVSILINDGINYLLSELSSWLQPSYINEFYASWPMVKINSHDADNDVIDTNSS